MRRGSADSVTIARRLLRTQGVIGVVLVALVIFTRGPWPYVALGALLVDLVLAMPTVITLGVWDLIMRFLALDDETDEDDDDNDDDDDDLN